VMLGLVMVSLHGRNTAAWEHPWLMMVRIAFLPCLGGSPVMRSIAMCLKGHVLSRVSMQKGGVFLQCVRILFY
jgi:hypothetical protein